MAVFRADEAIERGFERAKGYLVNKEGTSAERKRGLEVLKELVSELGPVIDCYPSWHPLVSQHRKPEFPCRTPSAECGYDGLDHTIFFAHGFVTCPYHASDRVISSVEKLIVPYGADISAEQINEPLYNEGTKPVVVRCNWHFALSSDGLIPKRWAVGLMLEQELHGWRGASFGETWETMRPYFLGEPHGARSSLFVDQETAMAMKRIWVATIESGVFGPVRH